MEGTYQGMGFIGTMPLFDISRKLTSQRTEQRASRAHCDSKIHDRRGNMTNDDRNRNVTSALWIKLGGYTTLG